MNLFVSAYIVSISWSLATSYSNGGSFVLSKIHEGSNGTEHRVNAECDNQNDCENFISGSICEKNTCTCPDTLILNQDRTRCIKPAGGIGSECEEDVQCSETLRSGGICSEKVCKCKTGYHYLRGECWKSQKLHRTCFKNEQCFVGYDYRGQECTGKTCKCKEGYYSRFDLNCRKKRNPGESCNADLDCPTGHVCDKMKCFVKKSAFLMSEGDVLSEDHVLDVSDGTLQTDLICPKGNFEMNGTCVLELGMPCNTNDDCSHIKKANCLDGVCSCDPVLGIANSNNRMCLQVARGKVPDLSKTTCKEDPQCSIFGDNSYCSNKKCACKNGSYWEAENQFCWGINKVGEDCLTDKDCHPAQTHAICKENEALKKVCTCENGYHLTGESCRPDAKEVGDYCEKDEECLFDKSKCDESKKLCKCQDRYYPEKGQCVTGVGSPCQDDGDCTRAKNTKCVKQNSNEKYCSCEDGQVAAEDSKYCLPVVEFGGACRETFQCKPKMGNLSECSNGSCSCGETAHHYNGFCHRKRDIGQSCVKKQECFFRGDDKSTVCLNGYCSCDYDYTLQNNVCVKTNSGTI
ncbi:hypothetical protein RUM43_007436 [Polyplax serrata]|uniref:EGF-like domain-containing protein n=1 Tax=Polyplax serrata TaxID=468196 RepID=A0AAN8SA66_POLSC